MPSLFEIGEERTNVKFYSDRTIGNGLKYDQKSSHETFNQVTYPVKNHNENLGKIDIGMRQFYFLNA